MEIKKAEWSTNGNAIRVSMPFSKVDVENRIVVGWATLDNVDRQGDVVKADASERAFSGFRGNIREMHQPLAVGKMLQFQNDEFVDPQTGVTHKGVWVKVYVSKGAESTWQKVLDGTLTGFSIGGEIKEASNELHKDSGKQIRIIKDYDLVELSLVDSPANPMANVFSIVKMDNGEMTGMVAETLIENVFVCSYDNIAKASVTENENCSVCARPMTKAGFIDLQIDKGAKIAEVVASFTKSDEGGVEVEKELEKNEPVAPEPTAEGKPENEVAAPVDPVNDEVVESTETDAELEAAGHEVVDQDEDVKKAETPDFEKMFGELTATITKATEATTAQIEGLSEKLTKSDERISALESKLETQSNELATANKALEAYGDTGALKKSADIGGATAPKEEVQKSLWSGSAFDFS